MKNLGSAVKDGMFDFRQTTSFASRYLETFYTDHPPTADERAVLRFLTQQVDRLVGRPRLLEVGCGPTIHHVLPFVDCVSAVDMADYLPENLREVRRWRSGDPSACDWRQYAALQIELQGGTASIDAVTQLEAAARARIGQIVSCDLTRRPVVDAPARYAAVSAFYCTEEVGVSITRWEQVMANLCDMVAPGGHLFMSCLADTDFYLVGDVRYPCARITEQDVYRVLPQLGFDLESSTVETAHVESQADTGVVGVVLVSAHKRP